VAAEAARVAVMPLKRDGGQPQYIVHEQPGADGLSLEPLLGCMEENAHRKLTSDDVATRASISSRTLNRRDPAEMAAQVPHPQGATPARDHGASRRADRR
jgi:transcriptional regulator GlxA family with amidase domain